MGKVLILGFLFTLTACRHGRCYRDSDCNKALVCADPDMKPAVAQRCGAGEVRCVSGCATRCTPESCGEARVCGESGCCEPRSCKLNGDCRGDDVCVDGKCTAPGRCIEPPEG